MNTPRRTFLKLSLAAMPALQSMPAWARSFPSKPITLVVPFAPGGNIDVVGRSLSVPLSKLLGQIVVVENRAGAGGGIGTASVARAEPDGHTLLVATPAQVATLPQMFKTAYDVASFQPVGVATRTSMIVVARRDDARFKSFDDLLALARGKPGAINAGHAGNGTPNHLALLQLENAAGCQFGAVAYKGSGPALVNLLGGQIDVVFDQVTSSMPHIKSGALRPLAILGSVADPTLPGVPTLAESNVGRFDATTYAGLLAPAGTPGAVIDVLSQALRKALADPQLNASLNALGSFTESGDAGALKTLLDTERALATRLVAEGRLTAN
ncbi:lipoprotein [Pigmentiphaga litoralis]|uniref:Bug family tripartite tricarboxylate transporter substrate binding protein n=1 Tax=Pigmentiphaga litoralis TaxID=516702 RepID=UPI00167B4FA8|nr:tripartite tricarboxylate transporter substrate binding protein [Pigmentiphaga litoralis]GGX09586.1 lipoprotein [Pigmentiphaga litoralis]